MHLLPKRKPKSISRTRSSRDSARNNITPTEKCKTENTHKKKKKKKDKKKKKKRKEKKNRNEKET